VKNSKSIANDRAKRDDWERRARDAAPDMNAHERAIIFAMWHMERMAGVGFGGTIVKSLDVWARESGCDRKTLTKAFGRMTARGLLTYKPGVARTRTAGRVKRTTNLQAASVEHFPPKTRDVLRRLSEIPVDWKGQKVKSKFKLTRTGRFSMSAPNLQSKASSERVENLLHGLKDSEVLRVCDYSQADPTVLTQVLKQRGLLPQGFDLSNLYQTLASIRSIPRADAKRDLLAILYSDCRELKTPQAWGIPPRHRVREFLAAVDRLRVSLWESGEKTAERRRHVFTQGGTVIESIRGDRMHRGKLLAWMVQGTVAEIFADALSAILDAHDEGILRFLLGVHDAVYTVEPKGQQLAAQLMEDAAHQRGFTLTTTQETHTKLARKAGLVSGGNIPPTGSQETMGKFPPLREAVA
jgi:hypothetical protein